MDFSFIRLEPTLKDALNVGNPNPVSIQYPTGVQLSPRESYLQISNVKNGIAFDENYTVHVCECDGTELLDITDKVEILEFSGQNGKDQIFWECLPIITDFYRKPVILKFNHTVSEFVWYSNPINISDYQKELTTRFVYKNIGNFEGITYANADFYQSIRLRCYYTQVGNEVEVEDYRQISSNITVSSNARIYRNRKFIFDYFDGFTFERLQVLLAHSIKYADSIRISNNPTVSVDDRKGDTPLHTGEFTSGMNYNEMYIDALQLHEDFELISFIPENTYTPANFPQEINGTFNRTFDLGVGQIQIYTAGGVLVETLTQSDLTVTTTGFQANLLESYSAGSYYVLITEGLFTSAVDEPFSVTTTSDLVFTIANAEFDSNDFNNEYLI